METTEYKRKQPLADSLANLRGNVHFESFLRAMDGACKHGQTVFDVDPHQSAFNQGRQSFANDVHKAIKALELEGQQPTQINNER